MSFMGGLLLAIGAQSRSILVFILYSSGRPQHYVMQQYLIHPSHITLGKPAATVPLRATTGRLPCS
jgi:hypothetical protein